MHCMAISHDQTDVGTRLRMIWPCKISIICGQPCNCRSHTIGIPAANIASVKIELNPADNIASVVAVILLLLVVGVDFKF